MSFIEVFVDVFVEALFVDAAAPAPTDQGDHLDCLQAAQVQPTAAHSAMPLQPTGPFKACAAGVRAGCWAYAAQLVIAAHGAGR